MNHSRRAGRVAAVLLTSCSLFALTIGSAGAEVWRGGDPRGDATVTTYSPEPKPCGTFDKRPTDHGDLTRLVVDHGQQALRLRLAVSGLQGLSKLSPSFRVRTNAREYDVDADRYRGRWHVDVSKPPKVPDDLGECDSFFYATSVDECRGADVSIDRARGVIELRLSRSCVGAPRWVRVGASLNGELESGAWTYDSWAPNGVAQGDFLTPVFSPRITVGRTT